MKLSKGGSYLKAKDAEKGTTIEILNAGEIETSTEYTYQDGSPKKSYVFSVSYKGEDKKLRLNKASRIAMIEAFGEETEDWIGKKAKLVIMPTPNGDNKMVILDPITDTKAYDGEPWDDK